MSIGFDYFFYYSNQNVGVNKKINDTVGAVTCLGYKAREIRISGGFFSKRFKMFLAILKSNAEIIVLRNDFLLPIVYFPILLWKRLCGVVVAMVVFIVLFWSI